MSLCGHNSCFGGTILPRSKRTNTLFCLFQSQWLDTRSRAISSKVQTRLDPGAWMSVNVSKTQPAVHVSLTLLRALERILSRKSELLTLSQGRLVSQQMVHLRLTLSVVLLHSWRCRQAWDKLSPSSLETYKLLLVRQKRTWQCPDCRRTPPPREAEA